MRNLRARAAHIYIGDGVHFLHRPSPLRDVPSDIASTQTDCQRFGALEVN